MDPDLLLQNHILPPALSEQMALHRHRKRKHPHCQRGVLQSLRLRHHVEQSHRTVSLYFAFFPPLLAVNFHYLLFALVWVDTHPGNSEMQRNVCLQIQCVLCAENTAALISVRAIWRWWLCLARICCWDFWRCLLLNLTEHLWQEVPTW